MFDVGGGELLFIIIVALLLFGPKKIPEVAQMVSKGMRKVKEAQSMLSDQMNEIKKEVDDSVQEKPKSASPKPPTEKKDYHPPTQIIDARRDQQFPQADPNSVRKNTEENSEIENQLDNLDDDIDIVDNPQYKDKTIEE
jgi:sec-independent protein translocase protein TatA